MQQLTLHERIKRAMSTFSDNETITVDDVIVNSLAFAGGTLGDEHAPQIEMLIRARNSRIKLDNDIKNKFLHLSNAALVARANSLPDFKWDDEGHEISRRMRASNGRFKCKMINNKLQITKDI